MHGRTATVILPTVSNSYTSISIGQSSDPFQRVHQAAATRSEVQNENEICWSRSAAKRILDIVGALAVLAIFAIPMLLIAVLVRLTSKGPAVFVQERVGFSGHLFRIYKFRSMSGDCENSASLTQEGDQRITPIGCWLRKFKLDELPQFYNVLRGDMSFVGPRPKLPQYAEQLTTQFRPGITGAATLVFRCEEEILKQVDPGNLDNFYLQRIKPLKERIDRRYMSGATLWSDVGLIFETFRVSLVPPHVPRSFRRTCDSRFTEPYALKANAEAARELDELRFAGSSAVAVAEGD